MKPESEAVKDVKRRERRELFNALDVNDLATILANAIARSKKRVKKDDNERDK